MPHALLDAPTPIAFAHRGGAALNPENTLLAFRSAVELGCPALELDVHTTSDDELVVFHDTTLERTTNGSGPIAEKSLAELRRLDAAYHFASNHRHPLRGHGIVVPTLAEVIQALPQAAFNVELKSDGRSAALLWALIRRHDLKDRIIVAARHTSLMREFRTLSRGQVKTSATRNEILAFRARALLGLPLSAVHYAALQVPVSAAGIPIITPKTVQHARAHGIAVHAWTINDRSQMRQLLSMGVTGIISDRPDWLLPVIEEATGRRPL